MTPAYPISYAVSVSCFRFVLATAAIGKMKRASAGERALRFTSLRIVVWMLLLMNDGARNARLNETRKVFAAFGLSINVVRGENTAFSIDENLSTRPPTTHRKWLPRNISSWPYTPPSLRGSPPGAIEMSNVL